VSEPQAAGIGNRLAEVRARIVHACQQAGRAPSEVELVAVSKFQPVAAIRAARAVGQRLFGENRIPELATKSVELAGEDLVWHMVGSVQTNKVKQLLGCPGLALIHSLDRWSLAAALHRVLEPHGRTVDCLVEVEPSGDPGKHGLAPGAVAELVDRVEREAPTVRIRGLMAIGPLVVAAPPAGSEAAARRAFERTAALRSDLAGMGFRQATFGLLSMGMSGDLEAAIAAGANLVRIGTAVFGQRPSG
jgi:pyridoxal phosphate enzyme (YggS family)